MRGNAIWIKPLSFAFMAMEVALQRPSVTRDNFHSARRFRARSSAGCRCRQGGRSPDSKGGIMERELRPSPSLPGLAGSPSGPPQDPLAPAIPPGTRGGVGVLARSSPHTLPAHPLHRPHEGPRSPSPTAAARAGGSGPPRRSSWGLHATAGAGEGWEQGPEAIQAEALPAISCLYSEHSISTK